METMHAAGRRTLPPVPRPSAERAAPPAESDGRDPESPTERFVVDLTTGEQRAMSAVTVDAPEDDTSEHDAPEAAVPQDDAPHDDAPHDDAPHDDAPHDDAPEDAAPTYVAAEDVRAEAGSRLADTPVADGTPEADSPDLDPAQQFVARLRASAADFSDAAGAESAVVREAVPPARHRRARCRLVLRYADESEVDVIFLGPAGRPGMPSRHGFDRQIRRWLAAGQCREDAWLVDDPEACDGLAVDLSAWVAAA
jgi:hypothetical protein